MMECVVGAESDLFLYWYSISVPLLSIEGISDMFDTLLNMGSADVLNTGSSDFDHDAGSSRLSETDADSMPSVEYSVQMPLAE